MGVSGPAQPPHRAGSGNGADLLPAGEGAVHFFFWIGGLRWVETLGYKKGALEIASYGAPHLPHNDRKILSLRRRCRRMKQSEE